SCFWSICSRNVPFFTTSPSRTARLTICPITFAERSTLRFASILPFAETLLLRSWRVTFASVTAVTSLSRRERVTPKETAARSNTATPIRIFVLRFICDSSIRWGDGEVIVAAHVPQPPPRPGHDRVVCRADRHPHRRGDLQSHRRRLGAHRPEPDPRLFRARAGDPRHVRRVLGLPLHPPRPGAGRRVHAHLANVRWLRTGLRRLVAEDHFVHRRAGVPRARVRRLRHAALRRRIGDRDRRGQPARVLRHPP